MNRAKRRVSRDIGVDIGSICSKFFLKSKHLHYGYWTGDLHVDIANLCIAQEKYAKFIISHIPDGVKRILDVGCGSGQIAKMLVEIGYEVDCVCPSSYLSKQARELLGEASHIFECYYEELQTEKQYDLILFCESFQYTNPEEAIKKTIGFLKRGGYVLICDFFKKDIPDKSPLAGGHSLMGFYDMVSEYPLEIIEDLDITRQTAPTLDIVNDMFNEVVRPTVDLTQQLLDNRYPVMSKFLKFLYRKRIDKINKKYFSSVKTGENFKKYKSYRLLVYKKTSVANVRQLNFTDEYLDNVAFKSREKIRAAAITALAGSKRLGRIVHYLAAWRTLAVALTIGIIIVKNIIDGNKPHELLPLKEGISAMAVIGFILVLVGVFIRFWAQGHLKRGFMVTSGPYAIVRHPLYLGSLMVVCGILFQLSEWMNWIVVLPVFTIFYGAGLICEERALEKKFGRQWQLYKVKTPVMIPSLQSLAFLRHPGKWNWNIYRSTSESWITPMLLILPLLIELVIEDFVCEGMLGI